MTIQSNDYKNILYHINNGITLNNIIASKDRKIWNAMPSEGNL